MHVAELGVVQWSLPPPMISRQPLHSHPHDRRRRGGDIPTSLIHPSCILNSFPLIVLKFSSLHQRRHPHIMAGNRQASERCNSAGRVTARLLLSFLALSTRSNAALTGASYHDQPIPILPLPQLPIQPGVQLPSDHAQVFVRLLHLQVERKLVLT